MTRLILWSEALISHLSTIYINKHLTPSHIIFQDDNTNIAEFLNLQCWSLQSSFIFSTIGQTFRKLYRPHSKIYIYCWQDCLFLRGIWKIISCCCLLYFQIVALGLVLISFIFSEPELSIDPSSRSAMKHRKIFGCCFLWCDRSLAQDQL